MIPLFTIQDEDRDVERRASEHVNLRKFFLASAFVFVCVLLLSTPLYLQCLAKRNVVVTQENLRSIFQGTRMYAEANNEGLPLAYEMASPDMPALDSRDRPIIWATHIMGYVDPRKFKNPKTPLDWQVTISSQNPQNRGEPTPVGYGITLPLSAARLYEISNLSAVLFAETISGGKSGSLNPLPLKIRADGFLIGFDDTNFPGLGPNKDSRYATRLAFTRPDSSTPILQMHPIHADATYAISAEGRILYLSPADQIVQKIGTLPTGIWAPFR